MTLFSMDSGVKRVCDAVTYDEISEEIELVKHNGWILYDAAGYDTIEMVKEILYSIDYIDKDFVFDLVDDFREIERERNRAWDRINRGDFEYDE